MWGDRPCCSPPGCRATGVCTSVGEPPGCVVASPGREFDSMGCHVGSVCWMVGDGMVCRVACSVGSGCDAGPACRVASGLASHPACRVVSGVRFCVACHAGSGVASDTGADETRCVAWCVGSGIACRIGSGVACRVGPGAGAWFCVAWNVGSGAGAWSRVAGRVSSGVACRVGSEAASLDVSEERVGEADRADSGVHVLSPAVAAPPSIAPIDPAESRRGSLASETGSSAPALGDATSHTARAAPIVHT